MAIHIEKLEIGHFRGIHHLTIENLNHLNIIAGDNNSGKTSVLEALMLLRSPNDFTNILRLARMRESNVFMGGASVYENFINLFPRDTSHMEIEIHAIYNGKPLDYYLIGHQKKIMLDPEDVVKNVHLFRKKQMQLELDIDMTEADAFSGSLINKIAGQRENIDVEINEYTTVSGREIRRNEFLNVVYLSPTDHVRGMVMNRILRNDSYKRICLTILQLFDPGIVDLLILRNEINNRPTEYVKHLTVGNMPLSTYGDGIKKVLSLAGGIAQAAGGVLLIDEAETAIHARYYADIFGFLVKASKQFDVQVFITTHSIEAIDGLLSTQNYEQQNKQDDIKVITFKKDNHEQKTYSRVLAGRHVYNNREQFGFEVRL